MLMHVTYLVDPMDRLDGHRLRIYAEEAEGVHWGDADHEEFIVKGNLDVANFFTSVGWSFRSIGDGLGRLSSMVIQEKLFVASYHEVSLVSFDIQQTLKLGYRRICRSCLARTLFLFPISCLVRYNSARARSHNPVRRVFTKGTRSEILIAVIKTLGQVFELLL